jgi:MEMO1 family protein
MGDTTSRWPSPAAAGRTRHLLILAVGVLCLTLWTFALSPEVTAMEPVREPAVAGQFYPRNPQDLRKAVHEYVAAAQVSPRSGPILALLAPHAGYMYSGPVAGWAYRQIEGESFDTVVVLSPSHRVPFRGVAVMSKGAYRTPLGDVAVDQERCEALLKASPVIQEIPEAHHSLEHALEVQIPFLQVMLKDGWRLVPMVMGTQDLETARAVADALPKALSGARAMVIASSDLSHFHGAAQAESLDRKAIQHMEKLDAEGLWKEIRSGKTEACGFGPAMVAMLLAHKGGAKEGKLLRYAHSGDITGDRSNVVGYAAMLWCAATGEEQRGPRKVGVDLGLTDGEKRVLKEIARTTIQCALDKSPLPGFQDLTPTLREPRGAFVTLEKNHQLRGCIGFIEAVKPLHETIREMAQAAAFRDPRFPPLRKEEWPQVEVEISVLTPMRRIQDVSEIQVGTHGLMIVRGPYRGLLLPQVATDYGWDPKTFLEHTCTKAGLPTDAWKDPDAKIYVFSADVF